MSNVCQVNNRGVSSTVLPSPSNASSNSSLAILPSPSNAGVMENRVVVPLNVQSPQRGPAQSNDPSNVAQAVSSVVVHGNGDGTHRINLPHPDFDFPDRTGPVAARALKRIGISAVVMLVGMGLMDAGFAENNYVYKVIGIILIVVGGLLMIGSICAQCAEIPD